MPEAKQNTSKLAEMFARASIFTALVGIAVDVLRLSMAFLYFRGFDTPSLPAQGEQRRSSFFNIRRDIPTGRFGLEIMSEVTGSDNYAIVMDWDKLKVLHGRG